MEISAEEIRNTIEQRDLNQWHLLVASLLGSLAQYSGMFNQALLNQMLTRSMRQFVVPFFEGLPVAATARQRAAGAPNREEKLRIVLEFLEHQFPLAQDIPVGPGSEPAKTKMTVTSSGCRLCPIGVGKAQLNPTKTFCPFPTMVLETAKFLLSDDTITLCMVRERARVHVVTKSEGKCSIEFELGN
jgi:hypothetical protein